MNSTKSDSKGSPYHRYATGRSVYEPDDYNAESIVHNLIPEARFEVIRYYMSEEQVLHTYNKANLEIRKGRRGSLSKSKDLRAPLVGI